MYTPRLSVIIPCYDNGTLLSEMIDCIRRQTYRDWELIIVDDGSTDGTPDVVAAFAAEDDRIRLIRREREPKGATTCRNIGFDHARGEYLIFFDADDLIADTCFERRVAFMDANPDADYASFPAKYFTDSAHLPAITDKGKSWGVGDDSMDALTSLLYGDYLFAVWCNIYRRASLAPFRWDEQIKIYQDLDYLLTGLLSGKLTHRFGYQDRLDYYYRINQSSGTNICASFTKNGKHASTLYLFGKTLDALALREDYPRRREEFFHFIILTFRRYIIEGSGNRQIMKDYLTFCRSRYPEKAGKLRFINNMSIYLPNSWVRQKASALLCTGLFGHR